MKKYFLICLFSVLFLPAANADSGCFFKLAGRDFSREEALKLANGRSDIKQAVQDNFAAAAAIVLCSRAGIELSPVRTRAFLEKSLLLMPPAGQKDFQAMLLRENLTPAAWLDREQEKLNNQLAEAIMLWYIKSYGDKSPITPRHVQNWYYHNMDIFRRVKLDLDKVWAFKLNSQEKVQQALAALQQGMPPAAVREKFAGQLSDDAILRELHSDDVKRSNLEGGYRLFTGKKHLFLVAGDAVSYTALPLDDVLKNAIANALYEALAKARLAETLKEEFKTQKITFY